MIILCCYSDVLAVMAGTFFYWYYDHGWEQTTINSRTSAERAARSIGQVANMCIGLLTLPVTRNSAWHVVFGSSYEAMIKYHILLGTLPSASPRPLHHYTILRQSHI